MEVKHTRGPWRIERPRRKKRQTDFQKTVEHGQEFIIMTPCGHRAGVVNGPSNIEMAGECVANAQLCAAAPDLLEALHIIGAQSLGDDWTAAQAIKFVKQLARETIAKATGA